MKLSKCFGDNIHLLYLTLDRSVPTRVDVFPGLPHGFRRFGDRLTECRRWDRVIVEGIGWALSNPPLPERFSIATK